MFSLSPLAAQTPLFTADKRLAPGLDCASCHASGPKQPVEQATCLKCHVSMQEVAKRIQDIKPNPHDNHTREMADCTQCHHGHCSNDVSYLDCHDTLKFERKKPE